MIYNNHSWNLGLINYNTFIRMSTYMKIQDVFGIDKNTPES
jgi:hypothetical protein